MAHSSFLKEYWAGGFAPLPPHSVQDLYWYVDHFLRSFETPGGMLASVAALAFILGCVSSYQRRKEVFFLLVLPVVVTLLASGINVYPFEDRLILFLAPAMYLLIGEGVDYASDKAKETGRVMRLAMIALLLFPPIMSATKHLMRPREWRGEEVREVLRYINQHGSDADAWYIYPYSKLPYLYYSRVYHFDHPAVLIGEGKAGVWESYLGDLETLHQYRRGWIIISHAQDRDRGINDQQFFLYYLDEMGRRLDSYTAPGAAAFLYDLRATQARIEPCNAEAP